MRLLDPNLISTPTAATKPPPATTAPDSTAGQGLLAAADPVSLVPASRPADPPVHSPSRTAPRPGRVRVAGKFFYRGLEKIYLKGATYGPFKPDSTGCVYKDPDSTAADFAQMRTAGINCVRLYTVPPRWLLDLAAEHEIVCLVGIAWAQYVAFLDDRELVRDCFKTIRDAVAVCHDHPAVLAYVIGNEMPGRIVRWYGHEKIEKHLRRMCQLFRRLDPGALLTYANYPTTEYLSLPFLDFLCYNVYLDFPERFDAYLGRLHNIAGDRPLVMSEIGMDSVYYGEQTQADMLVQKISAVFGGGCAGIFIFAYTDEWFRHGLEITEWKFGLTDRDRRPRASFHAVAQAFAKIPFTAAPGLARPNGLAPEPAAPLPPVSVVVCSYNGSRTIRETLTHLARLEYPQFEVIIIDDGSKDATPEIAAEYAESHANFRLIRQSNQGLSVARNRGITEATGQIVAYIDDDAYPDPHWLGFLVRSMLRHNFVGCGGPNVGPVDDGLIAACVSNSPGGPTHVLLSDTQAEHIPGCNMAFWRDKLLAVGGFDPQFRIAGDDVDLCWRLQEAGGVIGFSPAAMVFHHRRNSVRAFWKQQLNYGRAEADLERKWPGKYNAVGNATWAGRLYGNGSAALPFLQGSARRVFHGVWGEALFQRIYHLPASPIWQLPCSPEWSLLIGLLAFLSIMGFMFPLLLLAAPVLLLALCFSTTLAIVHASAAQLTAYPANRMQRLGMRALLAFMFRLQPLARTVGRFGRGLTPWRLRGVGGFVWPSLRKLDVGAKRWKLIGDWLVATESSLKDAGGIVSRGHEFATWDLELRGGLLACVRTKLMTEDLQYEAQLLRWRIMPHVSRLSMVLLVVLLSLEVHAALAEQWVLAMLFGVGLILLAIETIREAGAAAATFEHVARQLGVASHAAAVDARAVES